MGRFLYVLCFANKLLAWGDGRGGATTGHEDDHLRSLRLGSSSVRQQSKTLRLCPERCGCQTIKDRRSSKSIIASV